MLRQRGRPRLSRLVPLPGGILTAAGLARAAYAGHFVEAAPRSVSVPRWSVLEIPLTCRGDYSDPVSQTEVAATFSGPGGRQKRVRGFWSGGRSWSVRFTPTVEGAWSYETESPDPGLAGVRGHFTCTARRRGSHGFLRRDPEHPYHFVWDDGARFFMFGQTYYRLLDQPQAVWQPSLDGSRSRGMNKVRFAALPLDGKPRFDQERFRRLDAVVSTMNSRGMVASLIVFAWLTEYGTTEEEERYARYLIARYAAFPNVIWDLVNEWNYCGKPREFWNGMGALVRREDPWLSEGQRLRPLSIHQQTRINFQFFDQQWPVHAIVQYGVRNADRDLEDEWVSRGQVRYRNVDEWGNAGIVFNLGHNMPVVNDEYGYIGEPSDDSAGGVVLTRAKHRSIIWGIYTAGGYGSAGDKREYDDGRPYFSTRWHDTEGYGDIQRLVAFFTGHGVGYWKMASHNELVKAGTRVYVLAEPGRQYVAYAAVGGPLALHLAPGRYRARRYDPRTGEYRALPEATGGETVAFELPPGDDWVLHLRSRR